MIIGRRVSYLSRQDTVLYKQQLAMDFLHHEPCDFSAGYVCSPGVLPFVNQYMDNLGRWCDGMICDLEITLPETNSSHLKMDGWKNSFLLGLRLFSGSLFVYQGVNPCFSVSNSPIPDSDT